MIYGGSRDFEELVLISYEEIFWKNFLLIRAVFRRDSYIFGLNTPMIHGGSRGFRALGLISTKIENLGKTFTDKSTILRKFLLF